MSFNKNELFFNFDWNFIEICYNTCNWRRWWVNISLASHGLVPTGIQSLPKPTLTKTDDAVNSHYVFHDDVIKWKHFSRCKRAFCEGTGVYQGQWQRSFDVFFDLRLNKRLSKQSIRRWFERPSRSLWRHRNSCNVPNCMVQAMSRGRSLQTTNHYQHQWRTKSMTSQGVIRPHTLKNNDFYQHFSKTV